MQIKNIPGWVKTHLILKTLLIQFGILFCVLFALWGAQALYGKFDQIPRRHAAAGKRGQTFRK